MSPSHVPENTHPLVSTMHASAETCSGTTQPNKPSKFPGGNIMKWEKEVQSGKTKYLPVLDALGLSSGVKKYEAPVKITCSSTPLPTKSTTIMTGENSSKRRAQIVCSPEKSVAQRSLDAGCSKPQSPQNTHITELNKPMQLPEGTIMTGGNSSKPRAQIICSPEKSVVQHSLDAGCLKPQSPQNTHITELSNKSVQLPEGHGGSTIPECMSPNAEKASPVIVPLKTHPCDPALAPSWKGSFDIFGHLKLGMLNNIIQAHPPSRVKRKVYEFSRLLPGTLKFEVISRGSIWTNLFHNHCPSKEDIGLYFFASETERSEIYIDLVESMRIKDLVMRTVVNGVELLVLSSTALCSDSQEWNHKHFLWGLFHRKRQDTVECAEEVGSEVIDMEVDMIGGEDLCTVNEADMEIDMIAGENIGRVDICVPRTATSVICDRPESVTALVWRTSKGGEQLHQVDVNSEPSDDFPPGFLPLLTASK